MNVRLAMRAPVCLFERERLGVGCLFNDSFKLCKVKKNYYIPLHLKLISLSSLWFPARTINEFHFTDFAKLM